MSEQPRKSKSAEGLIGRHGMLLVLLLLCAYLSLTTIAVQQPEGKAAAGSVAAQVESGKSVAIVARRSVEGAAFTAQLDELLKAKSPSFVQQIAGSPGEVREALGKAAREGQRFDILAMTDEVRSWSIFRQPADIAPSLADARIVAPKGYRWPTFLKASNLINVANQVVVIALLAIGMTLVIITGGIDLSVGSLVALSSVSIALIIRAGGGADASDGILFVASLGGIALCGVIGLATGLFITQFRLPPFIVTLGAMLMASGGAYLLANEQSISEIPDRFTRIGVGHFLGLPIAVLLMVVLYVLTHIVMSRTTFGRYVYAVGGNAEAARLSGVRVRLILVAVYAICGMTAALGGLVVTSQLKAGAPTYGFMYELYAIAAVVVGGTSLSGGSGRIFGTLVGALIIAVIQNGMNLSGVQGNAQKIVFGAVILIAAILDTFRRLGKPRG